MKFSKLRYIRPDMDEVKNIFEGYLFEMKRCKTFNELSSLFEKYIKLLDKIESMFVLAKLRNAMDMNDEFYSEELKFRNEYRPEIEIYRKKLNDLVLDSKFVEDFKDKYGSHFINLAKVSVKTMSEDTIELSKKEMQLISEYGKLLSSLKVNLNGKVVGISSLGPYLTNDVRKVRESAYRAFDEALFEVKEDFDRIYDNLVKIRNEMALKLGYENFVSLAYDRLKRTDYNKDDVKRHRELIKKYFVPLSKKIEDMQKAELSIDKIHIYDENVLFSDGNARMITNEDNVLSYAEKMYDMMGSETSRFFREIKKNEMMDLEYREGKKWGAFCTIIPELSSPFIFGSFDGTQEDVDLLTHEAGHAFQMFESSGYLIPEYRFPTLDSCEVHSMSMEFLTYPYMESFFGEDADKFRYSHLAQYIKFIPYGALIDDFQHFIYENSHCTVKERNEYYLKAEKEYLPGRDYDGMKYFESGRFYQKQGHLFTDPMYYIDYTLALNVAMQLLIEAEDDYDGALEKYIKLCKIGGSRSFTNLVESAGLISPFKEESFIKINNGIDELSQRFYKKTKEKII